MRGPKVSGEHLPTDQFVHVVAKDEVKDIMHCRCSMMEHAPTAPMVHWDSIEAIICIIMGGIQMDFRLDSNN